MKYVGGKFLLARTIAKAIQYKTIGKRYDFFCEPFVGGFNVFPKVHGILPPGCNRFIMNDANPLIPCLWSAVKDGWLPPQSVTEAEYGALLKRYRGGEISADIAFAMFNCTFGSSEGKGYAKNKRNANYAAEGFRSLKRTAYHTKKCEFILGDYRNVPIVGRGIIYCDPPYEGTTEYSAKIDHAEKHEIFRSWAADGHCVIVSGFDYEFEGKPFYEILFQKERSTAINSIDARDKIRTEVIAYVRQS